MGRVLKLYVKSMRVDLVEYTMPNWGHWCSAGYRSQERMRSFSPEDNEAIEYLQQKGVSFGLVDLSDCSPTTRLLAMITGMNKTPTLVLDDGSKLKGIGQIKENFEKAL